MKSRQPINENNNTAQRVARSGASLCCGDYSANPPTSAVKPSVCLSSPRLPCRKPAAAFSLSSSAYSLPGPYLLGPPPPSSASLPLSSTHPARLSATICAIASGTPPVNKLAFDGKVHDKVHDLSKHEVWALFDQRIPPSPPGSTCRLGKGWLNKPLGGWGPCPGWYPKTGKKLESSWVGIFSAQF